MSAPDAATCEAIVRGTLADPFAVLGLRMEGGAPSLTVFAPDAGAVEAIDAKGKVLATLERSHPEGVFHVAFRRRKKPFAYRLRLTAGEHVWEKDDPYRFGPVLGEMDEYLLAEGRHEELWTRLGAHPCTHEGVAGTRFALWAPNARRVSVVGHFNAWDGRRNPMRKRLGRRYLGAVPAGHRRGRALQVRDRGRLWRAPTGQGRPGRLPHGGAARHGLHRRRPAGA